MATTRKPATRKRATRKKPAPAPEKSEGQAPTRRARTPRARAHQVAGEPVEINLGLYATICEQWHTDDEAAGLLGIDPKTLQRRRAADPEFAALERRHRAIGTASQRRRCLNFAARIDEDDPPKGAVTMAIWVSKQPIERGGLGWSDRVQTQLSFSPLELEEARDEVMQQLGLIGRAAKTRKKKK